MKSNLKGGNAIVRLLLAHGEKIGMVAILACAGLLLWSAIKVPRLEESKNPGRLVSMASDAEQKINSFTYEDIAKHDNPDPPVLVQSKPFKVDALQQIARKDFPTLPLINPYVIPPQKMRTDPVLLAAEDLEVHSDSGLWATANPEAIEQRKLAALAEQRKRERPPRRGARAIAKTRMRDLVGAVADAGAKNVRRNKTRGRRVPQLWCNLALESS